MNIDIMNKYINYFIKLCFLKLKPQDIPASTTLFGLTILAYLIIATISTQAGLTKPLLPSLAENLFEIALLLATLDIALNWSGYKYRFKQVTTAIFGTSALFSILILVLPRIETKGILYDIWILILLALFIWHLIVVGHIVSHTFEISHSQAIIVSIIYTLISYFILKLVFPI